jgi:hypothetical protein
MSITSQQYANLTQHAYGEEHDGKKGQMRHLVNEKVTLEGVTYKVLEYMDKDSGYQGAIYQRMDTGAIVVAHRGTEFGRELVSDGVVADGGMVAARSNRRPPMPLLAPSPQPSPPPGGGEGAEAPAQSCMRLCVADPSGRLT